MNTTTQQELRIVWMVIITACLGAWAIIIMALIRVLDTIGAITW